MRSLVDMIIPSSETPGAAAAGVDRYIDERLSGDQALKAKICEGLALIDAARFSSLDTDKRLALLREYSEASGVRGAFFQLLKAPKRSSRDEGGSASLQARRDR